MPTTPRTQFPRTPPTRPISVPASPWRRGATLVGRALTRRCPYCAAAGIFTDWWSLPERCPACGAKFEREEGYFLGGYALNLIFAELIGLAAVFYLVLRSDLPIIAQQVIAVLVAIGVPLFFFPYARTLWIALDLMLNPPPEILVRGPGEVPARSPER